MPSTYASAARRTNPVTRLSAVPAAATAVARPSAASDVIMRPTAVQELLEALDPSSRDPRRAKGLVDQLVGCQHLAIQEVQEQRVGHLIVPKPKRREPWLLLPPESTEIADQSYQREDVRPD